MRRQRRQTLGLRHMPRFRRALIAGGAVVLVLVVVGSLFAQRSYSSTNYLWSENPGAFSLISDPTLKSSDVFDFGVEFASVAHNQIITLRSVSLPRGLPAHMYLLHEAITHTAVLGDRGWPDTRASPVYSVDGFQLHPHEGISLLLAVTTHTSGSYILGPVTVHANVPGWLGIPVPVEMTYHQFAVLCVQVSTAECDATEQWVRDHHIAAS